jgi:hypothetical protein
MASIINASSSGSGGIVQTADASGVLQLQNNGNITVTFDASSNMGLGTASPSARLSVLLSNSTAYANTAPSASNCTAAFINTASHVSGGTFVGYQLNISGDSQNRIGYFGAISGTSSDQALSLVFGVNSGAGSRAEALRINSNANLILQGGTTTASGVGITFPATQVASSDANCLDDYEEGTFTPVIYAGGSVTTGSNIVALGTYTKIGRVVSYIIDIGISTVGSGSGSVQIRGMPFTVTSGTNAYPCPACESEGLVSAISNFVPLLPPTTTYFDMYYNWNGTGGPSQLQYSNCKAGTGFRLTGLYYTS